MLNVKSTALPRPLAMVRVRFKNLEPFAALLLWLFFDLRRSQRGCGRGSQLTSMALSSSTLGCPTWKDPSSRGVKDRGESRRLGLGRCLFRGEIWVRKFWQVLTELERLV